MWAGSGNLSHEQDNLWPANQMQYKCQTSRCIFSFMHNLLKQRDSTAPKVKMCTLTVTHYTGCGCLHSHAVRCASIGDGVHLRHCPDFETVSRFQVMFGRVRFLISVMRRYMLFSRDIVLVIRIGALV